MSAIFSRPSGMIGHTTSVGSNNGVPQVGKPITNCLPHDRGLGVWLVHADGEDLSRLRVAEEDGRGVCRPRCHDSRAEASHAGLVFH